MNTRQLGGMDPADAPDRQLLESFLVENIDEAFGRVHRPPATLIAISQMLAALTNDVQEVCVSWKDGQSTNVDSLPYVLAYVPSLRGGQAAAITGRGKGGREVVRPAVRLDAGWSNFPVRVPVE